MSAFALPVAVLAFAVREHAHALVDLDARLSDAATRWARRAGIVPALAAVQAAAQPWVVYTASVPVLAWSAVRLGLRSRTTWAFVTMMGSWGLGALSKLVVRRVRPVLDDPLTVTTGYSFPSGHALNFAAASSTVLVLLWPRLRPRARRLLTVGLVALALVVGADRVLIGAHFGSDVIAGYLLGAGLSIASWIAFIGPTPPSSSARSSWSGSEPLP
ncbi:undecaprenyl-diphosphatase [Microlunatus flavus]|uniref:Undecaprenyl-diphosphatase n=2 Tax=Microlunatus flavus TaxID=1036181 RepID=A0A1H9CQA1_9ACTN|nr:undecaprenyl-diphosphatase [Microlunatus flavus]